VHHPVIAGASYQVSLPPSVSLLTSVHRAARVAPASGSDMLRQPVYVLMFAAFTLALAALAYSEPAPCTVTVGYRTTEIAGRAVALWYPAEDHASAHPYSANFSGVLGFQAPAAKACGRRVPLVVFSHGDLGCGLQSVTLTEELARHGYVVAAPDHADAALCHTITPAKGKKPTPVPEQPQILNPPAWNDGSRVDRRQDVEAVIDTLLRDREFSAVIDPERIGLAGHSLGGYTVVGMSGGWPSWRDDRVRAVLALSPYVMPFQAKGTLGEVRIPIMYQGGTLDVGITPFLKGANGAFAAAKSPAYLLILPAAGHFAWVNCRQEHTTRACLEHVGNARLAAAYGIAFFDRYLKQLPAPLLDRPNPETAEFLSK
jgi:predicted dienelactone hydrolase